MSRSAILHETATRLRVGITRNADEPALVAALERLPGVTSARVNPTLGCVVVRHDGRAETRAAVLDRVSRVAARTARRGDASMKHRPALNAAAWPALMAVAVPLVPRAWRPGTALSTVAARLLTQSARLRSDPAAVLLDAASLASLAISGQPLVVSTSVLLRLLAERLSGRMVQQVDELLDHLLPTEAHAYSATLSGADATDWSSVPLRALRPGHRIRLAPGDVVPVDGCVVAGAAAIAPAAHHLAMRPVQPGDHVAAGEQLHEGTLELRAESDATSSRLERLRAQVRHAIGSRDPVGRLSPGIERLLSLPLTASALVLGLTGDTARSAAMLQADPQQGLDLALPLAREAALYALASHGLLTSGLESIERLATARTLVLQDTGVLADGRWSIEAVHTEPGGDTARVRTWLAALADMPPECLDAASLSDKVVRLWVRHGAVLRVADHEVHLASRTRLRQVWGLEQGRKTIADDPTRLRRELAVVAAGRVVARVVLVSRLRPAALEQLEVLKGLGIERIAVFVESDGAGEAARTDPAWAHVPGLTGIADDAGQRGDWLADAMLDGTPLVIVHTVLRDLVPPGSLSLTPIDADAGSHGVLTGDPLDCLVAARRLAQTVHRRLRLQQGLATTANAALMTTAALRWLPPMATALLHHGFALLLLLDSLRFEAIDPPAPRPPIRREPSQRSPSAAHHHPRSQTA